MNKSFKLSNILPKQFSRLMIQWVVWIRLVKQIYQTINDRVDIKNRPPVFSQNIQTNFPLQVNVWVVDFCVAFDFWGRMGIMWWDCKSKMIRSAFPVTCIWTDGHIECSQIVWIGKINLCYFPSIEFPNILELFKCEPRRLQGGQVF